MNAYKYDELLNATDDEIIKKYDATAQGGQTQVWMDYFLNELVRRRQEKETKALKAVAWYTLWATIGAVIIALVALLKTFKMI